jgi:hypothetical protein
MWNEEERFERRATVEKKNIKGGRYRYGEKEEKG